MVWIVAVVAICIAIFVGTGNVVFALVPIVGLVGGSLLLRAKLHELAIGLFLLSMVCDNPKEHPAQGDWKNPLYPVGQFLYDNLNNLTGIQPLRFAGIDLILASMLAVIAWRSIERRDAMPVPKPLHYALALMVGGLLWLEVWGVGRGGDFKNSLWQIRPPIWYAAIGWVFIGAIRGAEDLRAIGRCVIIGGCVKVMWGFYYYWFICRPKNFQPDYVCTHSDSVIFVTSIVLLIVDYLEAPKRVKPAVTLGLLAVMFLGVVINGRRLAYIELGAAIAAIYSLASNVALRQRLNRIVRVSFVPVSIYLAIGWTSKASIFVPAAKIATLFSNDDRSKGTRDIENYNLIITWKDHLFLGQGMGQPYNEVSVADSIAEIFPLYRYIGHNSVLWLFEVGGYVGFACVWISLCVGAYYAALAHSKLTDPTERTAAAGALCGIVVFMLQAYGDMGMQSWSAAFLFGMGVALAGKLAVSSGAWPMPASVLPPRFVRRLS
jgi:hypothetical protein